MNEEQEMLLEYYNRILRVLKDVLVDERLNSETKIRFLGTIL